jgi:hypothetical protein
MFYIQLGHAAFVLWTSVSMVMGFANIVFEHFHTAYHDFVSNIYHDMFYTVWNFGILLPWQETYRDYFCDEYLSLCDDSSDKPYQTQVQCDVLP